MTTDWSATSIAVVEAEIGRPRGPQDAPRRHLGLRRPVLAALIIGFTAAAMLTLGLPSFG